MRKVPQRQGLLQKSALHRFVWLVASFQEPKVVFASESLRLLRLSFFGMYWPLYLPSWLYAPAEKSQTSWIKTESREHRWNESQWDRNESKLAKSFAQLLLRNSSKSGPRVLGAEGSGAHYFGVMEQSNIINKSNKSINDSTSIPKSKVVRQIHTMLQHFVSFSESSSWALWERDGKSFTDLHCRCSTACLRASLQASSCPWLSGHIGLGLRRSQKVKQGATPKGKVWKHILKIMEDFWGMVELPPKTGDTLLHKKVQGFLAGMELKPNFPQCEFGARNQKPSGLRFAP